MKILETPVVITDLSIQDIGREVVYTSNKTEAGIITSYNDTFVFVRYDGDNFSKATSPENLTFKN